MSCNAQLRTVRSRWSVGAPGPTRCVQESLPDYEDEGSTREARGAVAVAPDAWWTVVLTAQVDADDTVMLRLERRGGRPDRAGTDRSLTFALPGGELDAVLVLLAGVTAQARRDAVLPFFGT
jgi:hypothetical protein